MLVTTGPGKQDGGSDRTTQDYKDQVPVHFCEPWDSSSIQWGGSKGSGGGAKRPNNNCFGTSSQLGR